MEQTTNESEGLSTVGSEPRAAVAVAPSERAETVEVGVTPLRSTLEMLSVVAGLTTFLASLLFYFGWVRTQALFAAFNIDPSILTFSTQDYVLRGFVQVIPVLMISLILTLALTWVHHWLHRIHVGGHVGLVSRASRILIISGLMLTLFGFMGVSTLFDSVCIGNRCPFAAPFITPLAIVLGPTAASYGVRLRRLVTDQIKQQRWPPRHTSTAFLLTALLVAVGAFQLVGDWAYRSGTEGARRIGRDVACSNIGAIVYSKQRLQVNASGVTETAIGGGQSAYGFRYDGLVLFIRSGGKFLLLPEQWAPSSGAVIALPDNDNLRLEYVSPKCLP